jgi:hypothetical protein
MRIWSLFALLPLFGCGTKVVPGFVWDVSLVSVEDDSCHEPDVAFTGDLTMEYTVQFDGPRATLFVAGTDGETGQAFATGGISGCEINYQSVVWGEDHNGYQVRWQLSGSSLFRQSGDGCGLPANIDWQGTETFKIITSEDETLTPGCEYTMGLEGTFSGQRE